MGLELDLRQWEPAVFMSAMSEVGCPGFSSDWVSKKGKKEIKTACDLKPD